VRISAAHALVQFPAAEDRALAVVLAALDDENNDVRVTAVASLRHFGRLANEIILVLISHVIFGAVAGGIYELFDHYDLSVTQARSI
jgi:HEAT repeat protein